VDSQFVGWVAERVFGADSLRDSLAIMAAWLGRFGRNVSTFLIDWRRILSALPITADSEDASAGQDRDDMGSFGCFDGFAPAKP
jgi:hypothetical protein